MSLKLNAFFVLLLCVGYQLWSINAAASTSQTIMNEIIQTCNVTYKISRELVHKLNLTGAFPDEDNMTPMCFVKCWFETAGILSKTGNWITEKVNEIMWPGAENHIEICQEDLTKFTAEMAPNDTCKLSYSMAKCLIKLRNIAYGIIDQLPFKQNDLTK